MLNEDIRTVEEAYATAISTSDLRCETRDGAPRSDSDVLIAAGWSQSRLGGALLRLHTEWDGAEHARVARASDFQQAAKARELGARTQQTPAQLKAAAEQLARHVNEQQAKLLMGRIKTLPAVRSQLARQLMLWKIEDADAVAYAVLRWWLSPVCHACHGRKFEVIPDTARLSSKQCKPCGATGKTRVPHGEAGRRLANWIDECVYAARDSISKGLRGMSGR